MSRDPQRGWRDYWKADCAASCEPENAATTREISGLWQGWLSGLPDNCRILDIATGNGIVLVHAAAAARASARRFALTGVDLAEIDPPRWLRNPDPALRAATFAGGVAAESLPFADASFDAVVSQYGLEYADLERALAEAARVLAVGGTLVWLAHTADSEIVRQHRRQADELDYLLADHGPVEAMRRFAAARPEGGRTATGSRESAEALERSLAAARAWSREHAPAPIVREIVDGFATRLAPQGADALSATLAEASRRLAEHRERIRSLLDAALGAGRLARVRAILGSPPWTSLSTAEIRVGSVATPIGLHLTARKNG